MDTQLQRIELLLEAILEELKLARAERALRDPLWVVHAEPETEGAQDV